MFKLASLALLLAVVALTLAAEPEVQQVEEAGRSARAIGSKNPYLFLSVPRGRAGAAGNVVQGFQVVAAEDDDDEESAFDDDEEMERNASSSDYADEDDNQNDDDYDSNVSADDDDSNTVQHVNVKDHLSTAGRPNLQMIMKNAKSTHMMVSREQAGAIMVPDGFIEIEGQSVIDEKTGKAALLVPRAALDAIPDGSVVALMERSVEDEVEEERANRVFVRRRRKGSRRNIRRRRGGSRRRRRGGNRRRTGVKRRNVRVYTVGGNRRRGVRPNVIQG